MALMAILPVRVGFAMQHDSSPRTSESSSAALVSYADNVQHMVHDSVSQTSVNVTQHQSLEASDHAAQTHGAHAGVHCAGCFVAFFSTSFFVQQSNQVVASIGVSTPMLSPQLPHLFRPPIA